MPPVAAQAPIGPDFPVNTHLPDFQAEPAVALGGNGEFVIAWTSQPYCPFGTPPPPCNPAQDGNGPGVFARRYDMTGAPVGLDLQVNVTFNSDQSAPALAKLAGGPFAVVWKSRGVPAGVLGRMLDAGGLPLGGEFVVSATIPPEGPDVAALSDGGYVVVWTGLSAVGGRRMNADGTPRGPEFTVSTQPPFFASPRVAGGPGNTFMVVWTSGDGSGAGVFGRRYDASGNPTSAPFAINSTTTGDQEEPDVAIDGAGRLFVAWKQENPLAIVARRFDAGGLPLGSEFQVGSATPFLFRPAVSAALDGNALVTWAADRAPAPPALRGRWYDAAGTPGLDMQVNTSTGVIFNGGNGSAIADGRRAVVAWTGNDASRSGILARRYGGLQPVGVTVDWAATATSDGNGVFEPGETVGVEPAWKNVSGALVLPFTGDVPAFTGPSGGFYTVYDRAATYPLGADGAISRCRAESDCYAMGAMSPDPRPVTHWDTVFREDLGGNVPPLFHLWTLHLGGSFTDVPRASPFYRFVETILHNSVTGGCTASEYCPAASTSREQMAVFSLVAKEGAGYLPAACGATPMFVDVPSSSPFCRWIEELARRGVVGGCGGGQYCPLAGVTREQMAVFALKTLEGQAYVPPPCGAPVYSDVPAASPFCPYIEELTRRSVVAGCGGGGYCPASAVSREQMSVFLTATFALQLYGP